MGAKAEQKKNYIREKAKNVFMEKGFKNVTMKDVVDACGISRGGLYLYYSDTAQLFLDIMKMEAEESDDTFSGAISRKASAKDILTLFLEEQKKELLREDESLAVATYEYAFMEAGRKDDYLQKKFMQAVHIIERLIRSGNQSGEFGCADPAGAAMNIMFSIEGLKITSRTMKISERDVDNEIAYLMKGLGSE